MRRRHPRRSVPTVWLMTDMRMGDALWDALERLPRGGGVVFRHYGLPMRERRALLARVVAVARRRGLVVLGTDGLVTPWGAHNRRPARGLYTRSAHDRAEIVAAERAGADAVFVSPVFPTRSHPGARVLGVVRFGLLVRGCGVSVIALGGVDGRKARWVAGVGAFGWAGIDAWVEGEARHNSLLILNRPKARSPHDRHSRAGGNS